MAVTREPDYPAEMAQLMQAFNVASDGFDANTVLNAALQMVAAAIGMQAKAKGASLQDALYYADHIAAGIKTEVEANWDRSAKPADVPVRPQ
jgi:hypothetical protein